MFAMKNKTTERTVLGFRTDIRRVAELEKISNKTKYTKSQLLEIGVDVLLMMEKQGKLDAIIRQAANNLNFQS